MKKQISIKKMKQLERRIHSLEQKIAALEKKPNDQSSMSYYTYYALNYALKYAMNFAKVYGAKLALDYLNAYMAQSFDVSQENNSVTNCLLLSNGLHYCNLITPAFATTLPEPPKFVP